MLTEIFQYLRNWFEKTKYFGDFVVSGSTVTFSDGSPLPLLTGQYFRIIGSVLNDGVYEYGNTTLKAESFNGAIWSMSVPPALISTIADIKNWVTNNTEAINSPYQSESFGGYSYSYGYNSSGNSVSGASWQSQFAVRLAPWRKI